MSHEDRIYELEQALESVLDLFSQAASASPFTIAVVEGEQADGGSGEEVEMAVPQEHSALLEDAFLTLYKELDEEEV